jgi:hypothetical protein
MKQNHPQEKSEEQRKQFIRESIEEKVLNLETRI